MAATQTPGDDLDSAVAVLPVRAATATADAPPASGTTEDRVESVARELGLPADTLRLALVKLGYLPAPCP